MRKLSVSVIFTRSLMWSLMLSLSLSLFLSLSLSLGCSENDAKKKVLIAINPWPGYEFIYLASEKGFFKEEGLNVELVELASLADVTRVFEQGRVDAMASTIIEAVQAAVSLNEKINLLMVPDYSDGGDVIIANRLVANMKDLKGKTVGVEMGLLGTFILSQSLNKIGMKLDDVSIINTEQLVADEKMRLREIDAIVTYPPFSNKILKNPDAHTIFSSSEIPGEVIDVISIRAKTLKNPVEWQRKFFKVWQKSLDFAEANPEEAYQIMAKREGVTPKEFQDTLSGMKIVEASDQAKILGSKQLKHNISMVCETLIQSKTLDIDCSKIHELISPIFDKRT